MQASITLLYIFLVSCCLISCTTEISPTLPWQIIHGRDEPSSSLRKPIYRAKVPKLWQQVPQVFGESILDTRKPLIEWTIPGENPIHITVHNFPTDAINERIPPIAQVARWKNQLMECDPTQTVVSERSHGGFVGLFLDTQGFHQQQPRRVLAWSMQLATCYYPYVSCRQRRADYTIKAWGTPSDIVVHRSEIIAFVDSFELVDELP